MCSCRVIALLLLLTVFSGGNGENQDTKSSTSSPSMSSSTTSSTGDSTTEDSTMVYNPRSAYCFEFTWLGPGYDRSDEFNQTCEDFLTAGNNNKNGLCRQPFVITNDSTVPDIPHLWTHNKLRVVRQQRRGEVCARWSYRFNDEVMNITYFRTKVFVENEGPVESGCYTQMHGSYEAELCVCLPTPGDVQPCNAAPGGGAHLGLDGVNARLAQLALAALACALLTRWLI